MTNAENGRVMPLRAHIAQSIRNILFTRIGTRVQREEYGSLLPDLVDMPMNEVVLMFCRAAVVDALARWEPRIAVKSVDIEAHPSEGRLKIALTVDLAGNRENFEVVL